MENTRKKQIVGAIQEELKNSGISQNVWARQSGICKAATLSNVLNERWEHVSDSMWTALEAYVMRYEWGYYNTVNAKAVMAACMDAQQNNKFNTITGFTGAGKTTALYHYKKGHDKVYLLTCRSSFGAKDLLAGERLKRRVQSQLRYDGYQVASLSFDNGKIRINAKRIN